ncbi:MAG: AMP-binding protein, partial [Gemmatimonadetes bacterium]|nr:AMP-binding protein [Gemmatimonadota bacterium]
VSAGIRPGDVVAIWAHRGAALVSALLAILRYGGAFLVLDPAYPPARLADYVRIARPRGFITLPAAGEVPEEVDEALAASVVCRLALIARSGEQTNGDAASALSRGSDDAEARSLPLFARLPVVVAAASAAGHGGREHPAEPEAAPTSASAAPIGPDTLAYLSFTSGTTGVPKAVMGRHGSLTHFTPWLAETFGLGAGDRFSMLSGLAHDPLHRDVFTPLQLGAAVVAPDPEQLAAPGYLAQWLRDAEITVAHLTPAMGQLIADVPGGVDAADPVPSLRRAFFVGDVLTRGDVERLRRLAPNLGVVNYYGSTETQRAVGYHAVQWEGDDRRREVIPLGRGIPGVQLLVRTPAGGVAGIGEVGEIWLRSPHVALGYLGDAELTAARFVRNPWRDDPADVLYRTGDLGRYRPDGQVEPLGRADQQVKVRGFRVELGEIEAALARHPSVREAVVLARGDAADRRLVAYVVPAEERDDGATAATAAPAPLPPADAAAQAATISAGGDDAEARSLAQSARLPVVVAAASAAHASDSPDPAAPGTGNRGTELADILRPHLRALLPEFMIPSAFVVLDRLPLTANGKVDRRVLPDPAPDAAAPRVAPRTETERALAEIWREVLGRDVGVEDDFFAVGGHSLRATQVLSRIEHRLGVRLPVKTVFAAPTIAALAAEVDARRGAAAASYDTADEAGSPYGPGVYPLSFAQQRLWVIDRLEPGSAAYNLPAAYRVRGALDVAALERALGELVRRHETLRTRIETRGDDEPVQVVDPAGDFHLPVLDRPGIADDELARLASDEANRPFDLACGPLFRATLVRIADDDQALLWTLHHVVSDGWSTGIFLRELSVLY